MDPSTPLPRFVTLRELEESPTIEMIALVSGFVRLLRSGRSAEQAAEALGTNKVRLLRRAKELAALLGPEGVPLPLIDCKQKSGCTPTKAADRVCEELEKLVAVFREVVRRLRSGAGAVAVGATDFAIAYLLPDAVGRFLRDHPAVELQVVEGEWFELLQAVRDRRVDFGFGPWTSSTDEVETEQLVALRYALLCPPGSTLPAPHPRRGFDWASLAGQTVLVVPEQEQYVRRELGGKARCVVLPLYSEMAAWVRKGLGVAVVLGGLLTAEEQRGLKVIDISTDRFLNVEQVGFYFPAGGAAGLAAPARALVDRIRDSLTGPQENSPPPPRSPGDTKGGRRRPKR